MLDGHYSEWLNLLVRWFHITAGIAWIGASFYFNWLENNLVRKGKQKEGITGYLWAIHGGGIYRLEKYKSAPDVMPETLHWFKWEAYVTWLTGMALLFIHYYMNATLYLIDPQVMELASWQAISIGLAVIVFTWVIYDFLCNQLQHKTQLLLLIGFVLMVLAAYGLSQVFSGRGAFIHIGAMIGTIMVANVSHVIMPSQRALLAAVNKGEAVDPKYGAKALLRSRHNNYLTLPVLFIMISNHYPSTFGAEFNWVILVALVVISAAIRHYFNSRHQPEKNTWILPIAAIALITLAWVTKPAPYQAPVTSLKVSATMVEKTSEGKAEMPLSTMTEESEETVIANTVEPLDSVALQQQAMQIIQERCASCHAAKPTTNMFATAPNGIMFDTEQQINIQAARIYQRTVVLKTMPLVNITKITEEERAIIGQWYHSLPPK